MCGIFGILREQEMRTPPPSASIEALLDAAASALRGSDSGDTDADRGLLAGIAACGEALSRLDRLLCAPEAVRTLLDNPTTEDRVREVVTSVEARVADIEARLDHGEIAASIDLEALNQALSVLKDATWAIGRDRLRTVAAVIEMAGRRDFPLSATAAYVSLQVSLSAIDRLEVRGRDSAGISIVAHGQGLVDDALAREVEARRDELFLTSAVDRAGDTLVFVYKAAAEIGALGDNIRHIRRAITADALLRDVLTRPGVSCSVVAHTRWASVGTISEPNAHPVDSCEVSTTGVPCVIASLNGDVTNYVDLKNTEALMFPEEITTDAKVIPAMVARRLRDGSDLVEAFRSTVSQFQGSVAIAAVAANDPDRMLLAVKGSGQGCYIGLGDGEFVVASEPYGLVEVCSQYVRLDGETPSQVSGKSGQIVELRRDGAGTLSGIRRFSYGGEELPFDESDVVTTEVTTRDIDRGGAEHFLLKEITESPQSIRRTLRGKLADEHGRVVVRLPEESLPVSLIESLRSGAITQVIAIGQGTAAIAAQSLAMMLEAVAPTRVSVTSRPATELSGFGLRDDMSDTLVVAVSQSGTTTDTNRTVDLVRLRGASVLAIVNRRQSDLTQRADGVIYTSDGRDVEMSVASTKAFYSQIAACMLLAIAIADAVGDNDRRTSSDVLSALRSLPDAMGKLLEHRSEIAALAQKHAPPRKSWAIVGSGPNYIAAREIRIKLSELCYKSIAIDITEDKKHIDLSAEPMILVCAAGLDETNRSDIEREVEIYRAHKAAAIVIASEGARFEAAAGTVTVPALHPLVDFVLSAMVGHLFGYEAALAIDAQARLLRNARAALDDVIACGYDDPEELRRNICSALEVPAAAVLAEIRSGAMNGHLEASKAVHVASLLQYATGVLPLDSLEIETGRPTSPWQLASDLLAALTAAIDELTRPIDAVKHQAKTVTVGISRTEDTFSDNWLVQEAVGSGAQRDRLGYRSMRTLASLAPAVERVVGFTRYEIEGDAVSQTATARVVAKGGVATQLTSRLESDPRLTGTKHRAAFERMVTVGRGQRDGREFIIVPEHKGQNVTAITLLHVDFAAHLDAQVAKSVLTGYRNRYSALVDAVTETEPHFDDELLASMPIIDLLVEPVWILAARWRGHP